MWLLGARPKTLPAAIVPVVVGTAAVAEDEFTAWRFGAALIVALALQVATNYANDYSDGVRGTDDDRVGPLRLVGSGAASPAEVKTAVFVAFAVAGLAGLALAIAVSPWLLLVGAASIAAGWFYTGGSNPYGYLGLGEVFVFVFFGLVATIGSAYVQIESITGLVVALSVAVGLFATALLVVNNLRDREGDAAAGKNTLAVRIGDQRTRVLYSAMITTGFLIILVTAVATGRPSMLIAFVGAAPATVAIRAVVGGATGNDLIAALEKTGLTQLSAGLGLAVGLLF